MNKHSVCLTSKEEDREREVRKGRGRKGIEMEWLLERLQEVPVRILEAARTIQHPHTSTLCMEEPGGLQSMGLLRVGHD